MKRAPSFALLAVLSGCATARTDAQAPVVVDGAAFRLTCHGGDEALARAALAVVEPVWPLVCEVFDVRDATPSKPLAVHLYVRPDDYHAADRALTGGRFGPNQAMSHHGTKSAHVALQPPVAPELLRARGLPLQTQVMLAWEAAHVARFELCANHRLHPGWFLDALAATTAERVLRQVHGELGPQPFFEQRWLRVQRLAADGGMPTVERLLRDATGALEMRDRYAARIAFGQFLRDGGHEQAFRAVARTIRRSGAGSDYAANVRAAAMEQLADLDPAFRAAVAARDPAWNEAIRSLWCVGDDWTQVGFPDQNAIAWRRAPVAGGAFLAEGRLTVLDGPMQQLNFLFARSATGFCSLAFVAGRGVVLFEHRYEGNQWQRVGAAAVPGLRAGEPVAFTVRGAGRRIDVEVAATRHGFELSTPLPDEIVWGVGAQAGGAGSPGAAGIWSGLRVVAPEPR